MEIIENFCDDVGKKIAKILMFKYDEVDFNTDSISIEKEIYEISLSYAGVFVFENKDISINRGYMMSIINASYNIKEKQIDKMSNRELIAHLIKLRVVRCLESYDRYML